jgi:putative ABC transport system permease protein
MTDVRPGRREASPRFGRWLAGVRVPWADREFAMGDLEEEYDAMARTLGPASARRWYWRQVVQALRRTAPLPHRSPLPPIRPGEHMKAFFRDSLLAVRRMWTHPVVTLAAVLTFALGIGANVAMFSVAWPVLFAPLPFADEDRLTIISLTYQRGSATFKNPVSRGDYLDLRTASSFEMAAYYRRTSQLNLTGFGAAQQITVGAVTPEFFPLLGIRPVAGSLQTSTGAGPENLIVLNERTWRRRFGGDTGVIGRTLRLDGTPYRVIGVAPAASGLGTVEADGWQIRAIDASDRRRGAYFLGIVARLKSGVTLEAANAELAAIMGRAAVEFPQFNSNLSAQAERYREQVTGPIRPTLTLLLVSASMVLLIATINLTGLQRARDLERDRERSIRRALGASSWHLARQAIAEAMALAVIGGIFGVLIALGIVSVLVAVAPSFGWHEQLPTSRFAVALYTVALTGLSGAAIALWPAWKTSRHTATHSLHTRSITASRAQMRMRSGVVATQVALTAVLLVVAALVAASQRNVLALDTGFDPTGVRVADLSLPPGSYDSTVAATKFYDALTARLKALPGVVEACVANEVPLDRGIGSMTYVPEGTDKMVTALPNTITPACLDVLRLKLLAGRRMTNDEPVPSVMVSASMARALFPDGRNPIGQRVHFGVPTAYLLTIVGVVDDIRDGSLETSHGRHVWAPQSLGNFPPARLLVQYRSDRVFDDHALRAAVTDLTPDVALARPRSLTDVVLRATSNRRFVLFLLSGFAGVAVLLCGVGLYGLLAHAVGQRTREIGIRMALGARSGQVLRLLLWQISIAVGLGIAAGLFGARALSGFVGALLYGITPTDTVIYVGVAALVTVITALSIWPPSRRALRIDPRTAMGSE